MSPFLGMRTLSISLKKDKNVFETANSVGVKGFKTIWKNKSKIKIYHAPITLKKWGNFWGYMQHIMLTTMQNPSTHKLLIFLPWEKKIRETFAFQKIMKTSPRGDKGKSQPRRKEGRQGKLNSHKKEGGLGGPRLPSPEPCIPGSCPFFLRLHSFAFLRLWNIRCCWMISPC